jgi:hypothetical protein
MTCLFMIPLISLTLLIVADIELASIVIVFLLLLVL